MVGSALGPGARRVGRRHASPAIRRPHPAHRNIGEGGRVDVGDGPRRTPVQIGGRAHVRRRCIRCGDGGRRIASPLPAECRLGDRQPTSCRINNDAPAVDGRCIRSRDGARVGARTRTPPGRGDAVRRPPFAGHTTTLGDGNHVEDRASAVHRPRHTPPHPRSHRSDRGWHHPTPVHPVRGMVDDAWRRPYRPNIARPMTSRSPVTSRTVPWLTTRTRSASDSTSSRSLAYSAIAIPSLRAARRRRCTAAVA